MMEWLSHLTFLQAIQYLMYWIGSWSIINNLLPPRETFKDFPGFLRWYNVVLQISGYWGAMNLRSITVKAYGAMGVTLADKDVPSAVVKTTTEVIPADEKTEASKTVTTTPVTATPTDK